MYRGEDLVLDVTVLTRAGVPVDLEASGTALTLTVKRSPFDDQRAIGHDAVPLRGQAGRAQIPVVAADSKPLEPALYYWDLYLTSGSPATRTPVLGLSPWAIVLSVANVP